MAQWLASLLHFIWPWRTSDHLQTSDEHVKTLPLRASTKCFVLVLQHPECPTSVVYMLSALALSERSATDAQNLVKAVRPETVIAQVDSDFIHVGQSSHCDIPTTPLDAVKESFLNGCNIRVYEKMAAAEIIKHIFGTSANGHVEAAKEAATGSNSAFYYLRSPYNPSSVNIEDVAVVNQSESIANKSALEVLEATLHSLVTSSVSPSPFQCAYYADLAYRPLDITRLRPLLSQASLSLQTSLAGSFEEPTTVECNYKEDFDCPAFANSFYPLLSDLNCLWKDLPGLNGSLQSTQKILTNVEKGLKVDHTELALSQKYRLAIEGLRVALTRDARNSLKMQKRVDFNSDSNSSSFEELSYEEKCSVILAQALKQEALKHGKVVVILDANSVASVCKFWNTKAPHNVEKLAEQCLVSGEVSGDLKDKSSVDKLVVIFGASVAAALSVASVSNFSTAAVKILTFKAPTLIKLGMIQSKRGVIYAASKIVSPVMKVALPSLKGLSPVKFAFTSKATALKASASASTGGKIRVAAHSVVASAERASISAIRTAFYNLMWNRKHHTPVKIRPWLVFGGSVATCVGLFSHGDKIENAVEAIPVAASAARLGQGIQGLKQASRILEQTDSTLCWEDLYDSLYSSLKLGKIDVGKS